MAKQSVLKTDDCRFETDYGYMVITSKALEGESNSSFSPGQFVKVGQEYGIIDSLTENPDLVRVQFTTGPQSGNILRVVAKQVRPR